MAIERKFLSEAVKKLKIDRYVREELKRVGVGDVIVKRTPLGTRIIVESVKPGLVIGRKGKNIQLLTDTIKERFKVENPQLEVGEIPVPEFNPGIMAKQLAYTLEGGVHFRRAAHNMIQQIMKKGAWGVMIVLTGKISGARARSEKFKAGYIRYCGEPANLYMKEAVTQANLKPGIVGVKIRIMPPIENPVDELALREVKFSEESKNLAAQTPELKIEQKAAPAKKRSRKKKEARG